MSKNPEIVQKLEKLVPPLKKFEREPMIRHLFLAAYRYVEEGRDFDVKYEFIPAHTVSHGLRTEYIGDGFDGHSGPMTSEVLEDVPDQEIIEVIRKPAGKSSRVD